MELLQNVDIEIIVHKKKPILNGIIKLTFVMEVK